LRSEKLVFDRGGDDPPARVGIAHFPALALSLAVAAASVACVRESSPGSADTVISVQDTTRTAQTAVQPPALPPADTVATVQSGATPADSSAPAALSCSPTVFGPGDTLTIRMWTPHGHFLTVTRSNSTSYFIVYPPVKSKPTLSLIPSDEFTNVATLRLPSDIRAIPYVYGRDTILETVFGAPGQYLLQMGDNIGTDYGTPPPNCQLRFTTTTSDRR